MILDASNFFEPSGGTSITATAASSNVIDLGVARDLGVGEPEPMVVAIVEQTFATLTSLNIQVQGAPDNGSGAPGTYMTLFESGAIPVADLVAGTKVIQAGLAAMLQSVVNTAYKIPRFLQLNYVVAGSNATAGKIWAGLALEIEQVTAYPPGVVVAN